MSSIHRDPRHKSPFWYCAFTLPDGRRAFRSTKQTDRKKAWDVCRALEKASEKARAGALSQATARKLFSDLLESIGEGPFSVESTHSFFTSWLRGKELSVKPGVHALYTKTITKFLSHLGDKALKPLTDIIPSDIAAFRDHRLKTEGVSIGTFILDLKALRIVFNLAKRQGLITISPTDSVDLPPIRRITREVFSPEEISLLLAAAPSQEWRTTILLGFFGGLRLSDAVSLGWTNVARDLGQLRYVQGKTGATVIVPIHPSLEKQLLELAASDNPHGHLCVGLARIPVQGRDGLSSQFVRIMDAAGIDALQVQAAKRRFRRKSFHSLRHSFASHLANAGVSADVRMKLTGHKTLDVHQGYTHIELEPLRAAIAALPRLV